MEAVGGGKPLLTGRLLLALLELIAGTHGGAGGAGAAAGTVAAVSPRPFGMCGQTPPPLRDNGSTAHPWMPDRQECAGSASLLLWLRTQPALQRAVSTAVGRGRLPS